jgi:hypothetical protein
LTSLNGGMRRLRVLSRLFVQGRHNVGAAAARLSQGVPARNDRKQDVTSAIAIRTILLIGFGDLLVQRAVSAIKWTLKLVNGEGLDAGQEILRPCRGWSCARACE